MAFCGKCGTSVTDETAFCPQCGAAVAAPASAPPPSTPYEQPYAPTYAPPPGQSYAPPPAQPYAPPLSTTGMQENVAGLLCYVFGWLSGIVFLIIDKRPFVRFHAAQSIVVFGILFILRIVIGFAFGATYYSGGWAVFSLVSTLITLVTVAAWIVLMLMAYQGKRFEVPGAAGIAKTLMGKV